MLGCKGTGALFLSFVVFCVVFCLVSLSTLQTLTGKGLSEYEKKTREDNDTKETFLRELNKDIEHKFMKVHQEATEQQAMLKHIRRYIQDRNEEQAKTTLKLEEELLSMQQEKDTLEKVAQQLQYLWDRTEHARWEQLSAAERQVTKGWDRSNTGDGIGAEREDITLEQLNEDFAELERQVESGRAKRLEVLQHIHELEEQRKKGQQRLAQLNCMRGASGKLGQGVPYMRASGDAEDESGGMVKAVITWLGCRQDSSRWREFLVSFKSVEEHFNRRFRYPILIFHEGDYQEDTMEMLQSLSSAKVDFVEIDLKTIPARYADIAHAGEHLITANKEYKNMCRFFSGEFFWHPATQVYDYYWRMDTDSFLLKRVDYDVFQFMHYHGYQYGWHSIQIDLPEVVTRLGATVTTYLARNPHIQPKDLDRYYKDGEYTREAYLNNFEISNFQMWRSQGYKDFYEFLEDSEGFWRYRWGDSPVHSLAVGIFLERREVHRFDDILYKHRLIGDLRQSPL